LKHYASRTCTFAVPDEWVAEPPFAFREPGEEGDRMGAQILERSLADMPSAASYARDQKPILGELYDGFELLQEGPQRLEGSGEGYAVTFKYLDEEEYPSRGRMTVFTCGPLVCQLVLSGPDGVDPERDRLFESIARTFSFRDAEVFAEAKAGGMTSETLRLPQAEAAKGWPGAWRKFPRCCIELPLPIGWEVVTDERDDVLFRRGSGEIRLHREIGANNEADVWLEDRMNRLREQGDRLLSSEQGELERGAYVAVLSEERGAIRTWKTAAVTRVLDLFWGDQQPLVWTLRAPEAGFSDLRLFLESLIAASRFLDPSEWETRIAEPWVDYVLKGHWEPQGPGLYVQPEEEMTFVQLSQEASDFPLDKLQPSILDSMRRGNVLMEGSTEVHLSGVWRGHEAFHYAVDGVDEESGEDVSLRAVWLSGNRLLYNIFVRGVDPESTEGLSRSLLDAFRAPVA
jgi:hypothetical protein